MDEKKTAQYQGLKVIGAGLPRTATTSLHNALEMLGYAPCHTFRQYIIDDSLPYTHSRLWQTVCRLDNDKPRRQKLLHQLYASTNVQSAVDTPTAMFIDDLIEMYPDAKVVLGLRSSAGAWRKSFNDTIGTVMSLPYQVACFLFPHQRFALQPILKELDQLSRRRYEGYGLADWESVEAYERHNEWVRRVVPKERLLEFEPKMGFEGLCGFLGVERPRDGEGRLVEFPRVNESAGFQMALRVFFWVGILSWGMAIGGVVGVVRWMGYV